MIKVNETKAPITSVVKGTFLSATAGMKNAPTDPKNIALPISKNTFANSLSCWLFNFGKVIDNLNLTTRSLRVKSADGTEYDSEIWLVDVTALSTPEWLLAFMPLVNNLKLF